MLRTGLAMVLLFAAVAPLAAAAPQPAEVVVQLAPDGSFRADDPHDLVVHSAFTPHTVYAWTLHTSEPYTIIELNVNGTFALERPRQAVPQVDGEPFVLLRTIDVADVDEPALVANLTGDASTFRYRLGLPGPAWHNLTLTRDTEAPAFTVGPVEQVTHRSFYVESQTNEAALGTLWVQRAGGGEPVENPTPNPAFIQRFPIQGLKANTDHVFWITFTDWSGNEATSDTFTVKTAPEPDVPAPEVLWVEPAPDGAAPRDALAVRVAFESPTSPVSVDGIRLFFDKREVHDGLVVEFDPDRATGPSAGHAGTITYVPEGPLDARAHSASVEITNAAGGLGIERWSFTVEDPSNAPGPGLAALAIAGVLGVLVRRRSCAQAPGKL